MGIPGGGGRTRHRRASAENFSRAARCAWTPLPGRGHARSCDSGTPSDRASSQTAISKACIGSHPYFIGSAIGFPFSTTYTARIFTGVFAEFVALCTPWFCIASPALNVFVLPSSYCTDTDPSST